MRGPGVCDEKVKGPAQAELGRATAFLARDVCVHAGLVAAAYLQAKDEENYREWKATEKTDCVAAGLPSER